MNLSISNYFSTITVSALASALTLSLSACAPAKPMSQCVAGNCAREAGVADQIETALRNTPGIEFWEVRVQYHEGTVYLYGLVATTPERSTIEQIALDTSGGKKVVNSIEIRGERF